MTTAGLPGPVREVIGRLRRAGGRVWLVGGTVRDALTDRPTTDYDLATDLKPAALLSCFPEREKADEGLGTVTLQCGGLQVGIASLREEADYGEKRRPTRVRFVDDPVRDSVRRDFTVNAIYADPDTGELLDPQGGVSDLHDGMLRMIGDPDRRLAEDPLRMLRAVRLAASCRLAMDARLRAALPRQARHVRGLSAERIYDELTRAFTGPGRGSALRLLVETGLADQVLPEVAATAGVPQPPEYHPEGDVLTHTALVLEHVPEGDPILSWAAVLHDVGKPATFERASDRIRFHGHDALSARMAEDVLRRLHAPRWLREPVVEICRDHIRFAALPEMSPAKRDRWLRSPEFPRHLEFHRADCLGSHGDLRIYEFAAKSLESLPPVPPPPVCTGKDVLALGVRQGPEVGRILRELEARLEALGTRDRAVALEELRRIVERRVKESVPGADNARGPKSSHGDGDLR